ncbi:MAG: shikimate kinase [Desulfovibrio sp.]|nr:shikimate kinase [Desulfovibrio sp.]
MSTPTSMQGINKTIPCVILIGMPGAGKTTIGKQIARKLHWSYLDSDHLIEATYGRRLQDIVDAMDKEAFLDVESRVICSIRAHRVVLGTGGSVVYRDEAMAHLKTLGPIIHLDVPLEIVKKRIASNPERGIAIAPGQTLEDIFQEREALYQKWSDFSCNNSAKTPDACVAAILEKLQSEGFLSSAEEGKNTTSSQPNPHTKG